MNTMNAIIESSAIDLGKLQNKKIKTSGQKLRANLLIIKKLCDKTRKQVLAEMQAIPTKTRKKVEVKEQLTEREVMEELGEIPKLKGKTKKQQ